MSENTSPCACPPTSGHLARPSRMEHVDASTLDGSDPFFSSFTEDYPDFSSWLQRVQSEHRETLVIRTPAGHVAALAILKSEATSCAGASIRTLKVCSFKVALQWTGLGLGESLLQEILSVAQLRAYEQVYVVAYPHHERMLQRFLRHGFAAEETLPSGELLLRYKVSVTSVTTPSMHTLAEQEVS